MGRYRGPMTDSYPRLSARTQRFSLGVPRDITIAPDGSRVVFLRSRTGTDPVTCLWELDVASGEERLIVDPRQLGTTGEDELPAAERARRERARESADGIVAYGPDDALTLVAFALSGTLWVTDLATSATRQLATPPGVNDPRPSPDGTHVAYVADGGSHVQEFVTGRDTTLAEPDGPGVTWGLPEFIAAEELDRMRGYWWSPDGRGVLVQRTDVSHVQRWHIGDPADPAAEPNLLAYPAAGTTNATVTLWLIDLDGAHRRQVHFDDEYLAEVTWDDHALSISTLSRDQRDLRVWTVDAATGATRLASAGSDTAWMDVRPGLPRHLVGGATVWLVDIDDTSRLIIGDRPVTPSGLQVRAVTSVDGDRVLFRASTEPTSVGLWRYDHATRSLDQVSPTGEGVWSGLECGGTLVMSGSNPAFAGAQVHYRAAGIAGAIRSVAEHPGFTPAPVFLRAGERRIATAVLFPAGHVPGSGRLPVLLDPYGGPGHQRVLASSGMYLGSQWFADQGYVVIVADGRGVPGRGPAFERAVAGDLASAALEDQVEALQRVAERYPGVLDLERVAIRGWSFGGFLAALAVLRRPDVFHAAIAGAPVTDWMLYDSCYTERYLGNPDTNPEAYAGSSLLGDAPKLSRPLMLIHGLADDNVVAAHTLRLSSALLAAGRAHTVLPLTGVTHMASQEDVAENLLLLQAEFLAHALARPSRSRAK